ncbi:hypothetical protein [Polyangium sorediatum]|uniref:Nucleoside phosphorylase domain-containing protein n=1 Tax=Polyangium sorediatum TaxID=889274 RepID=A0ABT6PAG3_9BACT|nr:hypothetical protein [Polyangium sorediatum]MDI1437623.1 hypothetical protein [Polyangium sorediatum]
MSRRLQAHTNEYRPVAALVDDKSSKHLIVGVPGSGKTHVLWQLAQQLISNDRHIPFIIPIADASSSAAIHEYVLRDIERAASLIFVSDEDASMPAAAQGTALMPYTSKPIFDIAILCATHDELEKVKTVQKGHWKPLPATEDDPNSYEETEYTTRKGRCLRVVAAAQTQMGMPASAVLAAKMILRFTPKLVAMVGIAGGAKSDKQKYGDVLVPNRTFDYNAGKLTIRDNKLHFEPDYDPIRISERLRSRLDYWSKERPGLDEISIQWPVGRQQTRIDIHVGPLGSGAAVIDAKLPMFEVLEHWRKLIGIEMEAYGVHLACQSARQPPPEFLCMKSISDFATSKTDEWRDYAAYTAAQVCYRFLTEEWENLFPDPR